jgi:hypothetical protein
MLFRKTLHTLEGVIESVDGEAFQIDFVLLREFLRRFAQEWPSRWFSWPDSRDFATRLSNLDLVQAVCSGPSTLARYWMEQSSDPLDA